MSVFFISALVVMLLSLVAERLQHAPVVVTTKQGESLRGRRCLTVRLASIVLRDAELLDRGERLSGRIVISRLNVAMVQELERPADEAQVAPS